ncbi:hypothetical protein C1H46_044430 [Malus baccata]|uniref:Uncharacterized protein n=1 Tax=Malus baccata TaxID=106549 RepID=A0A540K732_MALBA|nr:hypothetical protein C1H46_044430 [Malus baccata]
MGMEIESQSQSGLEKQEILFDHVSMTKIKTGGEVGFLMDKSYSVAVYWGKSSAGRFLSEMEA